MQTLSTEQGELRQGEGQAMTGASSQGQQRTGACPTLLEYFLPEADVVVTHKIVAT